MKIFTQPLSTSVSAICAARASATKTALASALLLSTSLAFAGQPYSCQTTSSSCFRGSLRPAELSTSAANAAKTLREHAVQLKAAARTQDLAAGRVQPNTPQTGRVLGAPVAANAPQ